MSIFEKVLLCITSEVKNLGTSDLTVSIQNVLEILMNENNIKSIYKL